MDGVSGGAVRFRDELLRDAEEVGIGRDAFRPLDGVEAETVCEAVERRFGAILGLSWCRGDAPCDLPVASRQFQDDRGWDRLDLISPVPDEPAWFLAENWHGDRPRSLVFEASPAAVRRVLGHSHAFEYLIAARSLDWLVAENHHGVVIAVGAPVVSRLIDLLPNCLED